MQKCIWNYCDLIFNFTDLKFPNHIFNKQLYNQTNTFNNLMKLVVFKFILIETKIEFAYLNYDLEISYFTLVISSPLSLKSFILCKFFFIGCNKSSWLNTTRLSF